MTKTYFLLPSFDIPPPPDGPIFLGHILLDPSDPTPLNSTDRQPIAKVYPTWITDFKATRGQFRDGKFGVWAQFLEMSRFGGELSTKYEKSAQDIYTFKRIDTTYFIPDKKYVEKSMEAEEVEAFMKEERYKKPVYMITGLKVARGARLESANKVTSGSKAMLGVDGPALIGPIAKRSKTRTEELSFGDSSDFVFAFRLRKIRYRRDKKTIEHQPFNEGAMFGIEEKDSMRKSLKLEIGEDDASAEDIKDLEDSGMLDMATSKEKDDDNEDCMWVFQTRQH
jgi:hypothetical protein